MIYDIGMLSQNDIKIIKNLLKNLATKDDLNKLENRLNKKFTQLFNFLDRDVMNHKND